MNRTEPQSYQVFETLPARVLGVLGSPRALFRTVIDRPIWADVMALTCAVLLVFGGVFMMTDVGRQALVDEMERTATAFGRDVDDAQYARFEELSRNGVAYAAARAVAVGPLLAIAAAAVLYGLLAVMKGSDATFRQTLAVTSHAGVVLGVRQLVAAPINYTRETLASPLTLTMFFPMFDESSLSARFLGAIDLFVIWWLVVLALGIALLYRRPARPTAAAFVGAYVGFAVLLAIAMAVSGGTV